MLNLLWFVLWLLSSGWLFLLPVFVPPLPFLGYGMISLAIVLSVVALKGRDSGHISFMKSLSSSLAYSLFLMRPHPFAAGVFPAFFLFFRGTVSSGPFYRDTDLSHA